VKRLLFLVLVIVAAAGLGAWAQPGAFGDSDPHSDTPGGAVPTEQKIAPCLWFHDAAEEAVRYYCSIFPGAKVLGESRMGPKGPLVSAKLQIAGQEFLVLNGNPAQRFTESTSFLIHCSDQAEVDDLWAKLTADGGEPGRCGWLKDKFGVSWQVIPKALLDMVSDEDPARAKRAVDAMLQMGKIDIARLRQAVEGR
jgi:predicted 3-demethylubiquinone-9 3-methyltransferase (glyoxalase superfamily)